MSVAKAFKIIGKNYLSDWGSMESWAQGVGSAPDGWLIASTPGIAQDTGSVKYGNYSARIVGTNAAGALGGLYRTIPNGSDYQGRTFIFGVWGKSSSTGPYIELNDGVTSKTVHLDGLNALAFFSTPAMKLDYSATQIRLNLYATTNSTAYFDSAVLCEGESLFTNLDTNIDVAEWNPSLSMKQDQYEIAQREGSLIPDNILNSRDIRIKGQVVGTDVASARTHFDTLMKSILSSRSTEMKSIYLYDDRVIDGFLKSFNWNYENSLRFIKYSLQFNCPDSKTRYISKLRQRKVIAGTVTEFNFAYNGSANSKPLVSFIANQGNAVTTCVLENLTTGESFAYIGTIPTGVALDIDCDLGTVFNSSVNSIAYFSGDYLRLAPGTNYFRYSGSNCLINVDYYERYL